MSSATTTLQLAERPDVHKSCRSIESLVNVLNDYCEAAGAIVALQKKLVKALRDTAGLKTTSDVAANALTASANIFDALAEVDSKFAKFADKECDNISSEVKKWFKKLSKDERTHDDRMSDANARIKHAGQIYEKKSKKSARDASEEHARYIKLLSLLGPEMSQEKHNHALLVTQRHTSTTYSVAACLSRVADAEWLRTCEHVRRFSPTIGQLGEWRALCEGNWTGPIPDDLPDTTDMREPYPTNDAYNRSVTEWGQTINSGSQHSQQSLPFPISGGQSGVSSSIAPVSLERPRPAFSNVDHTKDSVNSIATLSAFPSPPTHFPIPPAPNESEQSQRMQIQNLQVPNATLAGQAPRVLSESPKPMEGSLSDDIPGLSESRKLPPPPQATAVTPPARPPQIYSDNNLPEKVDSMLISSAGGSAIPEDSPVVEETKVLIQLRHNTVQKVPSGSGPDAPITPSSTQQQKTESQLPERDFGTAKEMGHSRSQLKSKSVDLSKAGLERASSTTSNGSIVAAMRNRYARVAGSSSPPPKDVPRLPLGVPDLASRYQPAEGSLSPRRAAASPTHDRRPTPDSSPQALSSESPVRSSRDKSTDDDELVRRRRRIEELAELEFREKEYELRQRERDIDQRARELDRDRAQFLNGRLEGSGTSDSPKGPRSANPYSNSRHSYTTAHLVPPSASPSSSHIQYSQSSQSNSQSQPPSPLPMKEHAPFCGCDTCSVTKYKAGNVSPSPHDLRPPEPPIQLRPEKPKGWIRRLSMPAVSGAFSLDAKKNASASSLKAGLPMPAENGRLRKRSFDQGISNRSIVNVKRR
ncbi:hypothetical protein SERLADRAFT_449048 [Serpula lacrymans var. lacrymans S7.9]|uniref:Uncharacterized protein n=1 Tax=Serpula lacrymans var. lacrymans (strain S7.9) TaxID=578457 RepID=F8NW23_SERL9|nr:uncharacterized protein SERLADRAFT_449048 [Serpula lacrymans var. lacrymans S7.9]EGO24280.1 hypothetical protein SERLADRAFT_449048 [Serpula lacrymans var. lacrymans S7.9]